MNLFRVNSAYQGYDKNIKEIQCITVNEFNGEKTLTLFSKDYTGRIFKNDRKEKPEHPDYQYYKKGQISVSVWLNQDKDKKPYFSTTTKHLEQENDNGSW